MAAATARGTFEACIVAGPSPLSAAVTLQAVQPAHHSKLSDSEPRWRDGQGATGLSLWLNAGVPATDVVERAGHSVGVLLRLYAK
jgi:hypothetical protein